MRFPNRSLAGYAARTTVVVLTLAVLQYTGLLLDGPAGIDPGHLAVVAVLFPAFSYLIDVVVANARSNAE
ncbi:MULTISPECIES: hypothetical protein [Halorubrum]|uniref:Uncharacterized protein n=1 Tax=Halorubrum ezzemoulense TaxID=337243 RepID=A0A256K4I4_HALEZ|nr:MULTISPECIES: hypothetical protein [Halorubrum]MDB2225222.1 hypothetical protein [Halorubrum ezzemoulense]MDB2270887.1 hypothetical protein [Halorubrum ezzemoulense]OYR76005.1 hypothetical protein DJ84_23085 [Halorubrum ezzemoulense]OYR77025.1 hypothetical protein DJ77_07025 [Halorubrum ezzemoulense]PHQ40875.1 hypothetical protein Z052_17715 [Halorubrum sp. C191]